METPKDNKQSLMDSTIEKATKYADSNYSDKNEARIAAKGFAVGYQQAYNDKNAEIKELAGIVKLLLPGIGSIPLENVKVIEKYIEKSEQG